MNELFTDNLIKKLSIIFNQKINSVSDFTLLASGWESKIYDFSLTFDDSSNKNLIIRIFQGVNTEDKAKNEFEIMRYLYNNDIHVPKVYILDISKDLLENNYIIMDKITGKLVGDLIFEHMEDYDYISQLFDQMVSIHNKIHSLSIDAMKGKINQFYNTNDINFIDYGIKSYQDLFSSKSINLFSDIFMWLKNNKISVKDSNIGLIHFDYHPWNAIMSDENDIFIIDWPTAMIGDIRFDIAWTMMLLQHKQYSNLPDLVFNLYKKYYSKEQLNNMEYFMVFAGLRRLVDAYNIIVGNSTELGLNPESFKQVKRLNDHYIQVIQLMESITGLNLQAIHNKMFNT